MTFHCDPRGEFDMASISERESREIEAANASGATPVVFVHGLWLLPSSWDRWVTLFEEAGYVALTPGWPDDPETVAAEVRCCLTNARAYCRDRAPWHEMDACSEKAEATD